MRHHRPFMTLPGIVCGAVLAAGLAGCAPSYPSLQVPTALQDICRKEHGLNVQVRVIDHTLTVYAPAIHDLLTFDDGSEEPRFGESVNDLIRSVHRVALSTDLPIDFYTLVMRDAVWPLELKWVQSLDDVRRADAGMIPMMEYSRRSLYELRQITPNTPLDMALEQSMTLRQFVLEQIRQRLELQWSTEGLLTPEVLHQAQIAPPVTTRLESGTLTVTVHVPFRLADQSIPQRTVAEEALRQVLKTVAHVVNAYRLTEVRDVHVRYEATGQSLRLPADELQRLSLDSKPSDY